MTGMRLNGSLEMCLMRWLVRKGRLFLFSDCMFVEELEIEIKVIEWYTK